MRYSLKAPQFHWVQLVFSSLSMMCKYSYVNINETCSVYSRTNRGTPEGSKYSHTVCDDQLTVRRNATAGWRCTRFCIFEFCLHVSVHHQKKVKNSTDSVKSLRACSALCISNKCHRTYKQSFPVFFPWAMLIQ